MANESGKEIELVPTNHSKWHRRLIREHLEWLEEEGKCGSDRDFSNAPILAFALSAERLKGHKIAMSWLAYKKRLQDGQAG